MSYYCSPQDSREISKLINVWETQPAPLVQTTWTRVDRLRKSATDLVETEAEYVAVSLESITECYRVVNTNFSYRV